MKLLCETQVINRHTQANRSARVSKATLAIGFHSTINSVSGVRSKVLEILHFTPQNKTGVRYKVLNNIEKIFLKFVEDGKITISFREPPENMMIKCDPIQLKGFLQTLKLGIEGKESLNLRLNIAAATAIPQKSQPQLKMAVLKRKDYPAKGFPKTLKQLTISGIQLCKLTFGICTLQNLTMLNVSDNNITKIPSELGRLSLKELYLNNNNLGDSTNTWQWLLGTAIRCSLQELDLSGNQISYFPPPIVKLERLVTLKLNNNKIRNIPFSVRRLHNLRFLHLSTNLLQSLPSIFNHSHIDLLDVWGNQFQPREEYSLSSGALALKSPAIAIVNELWILAARAVCEYRIPYSAMTLPSILVDVISESPTCPCGKLCFGKTSVLERAGLVTFRNVKNMVFSRDIAIYADIILCGPQCAGRKILLP